MIYNLEMQPYAHWKVRILAYIAKALGVQFKINAIPFGGSPIKQEGLVSGGTYSAKNK